MVDFPEKKKERPMNLRPDCFACLYNQMLRVGKALKCDDACAIGIMERSAGWIAELEPHQTPPEAAAILYPALSELLGREDLYAEQKEESIRRAQALLPFVEEKIAAAADPLDAALRAAVAGNVIDFATEVSFELEEEIERIFEAEFAIDDKEIFLRRLTDARRLVVLGDNAGEHCFDKVMIRILRERFPALEVDYFVRGRPIINDVTVAEAQAIGMEEVATIVDSGVDTPGFLTNRASPAARERYEAADLILAKGMGNFECMESWADARVFFLFKVKCGVVGRLVGEEIGALVCKEAG
jgi:uncharacterized protein with ATP-grasp and redox domains